MLKSIRRFLDRKEHLPEELSYEAAVALLESHSADARAELAGREDTNPEILYYLSNDACSDVRTQVAGNTSTPPHAYEFLVDDECDDVRCELAHKIGRLMPGLSEAETTKIRELTIGALERLAEDQAPRVRQIISEEIKSETNIPLNVVQKLARDLEISVAGPILEFSPLLSDTDLLEVIATGQVDGALVHIARRSEVSPDVSEAVVATLDVPAVSALLNNENAQIREDTLDFVIDNARSVTEWHEPIAMRSELSLRAMRRIAGFVAFSILADLSERSGLDAETQAYLKKKVRSRIESEETLDQGLEGEKQTTKDVVQSLRAEQDLDAGFVAEAIQAGQRAVVVEALATLARVKPGVVEDILNSRDGKPITALVWKAQLPMRVALDLQRLTAHVPPPQMVMAKDGVDFSLSEEEMILQLGFYVKRNGKG